jgi:hypothetical protein
MDQGHHCQIQVPPSHAIGQNQGMGPCFQFLDPYYPPCAHDPLALAQPLNSGLPLPNVPLSNHLQALPLVVHQDQEARPQFRFLDPPRLPHARDPFTHPQPLNPSLSLPNGPLSSHLQAPPLIVRQDQEARPHFRFLNPPRLPHARDPFARLQPLNPGLSLPNGPLSGHLQAPPLVVYQDREARPQFRFLDPPCLLHARDPFTHLQPLNLGSSLPNGPLSSHLQAPPLVVHQDQEASGLLLSIFNYLTSPSCVTQSHCPIISKECPLLIYEFSPLSHTFLAGVMMV